MDMKRIPREYLEPCDSAGKVERLDYGDKYALLYAPAQPAERILYLIHGGGGSQHDFFCPDFLNMVDHMIDAGELGPLYMVAPCFYDPKETDKTPASSGVAVKKFIDELRRDVVPLAERHAARTFGRGDRAIGGFSMGGVTTWYAFMEALDLFHWFLPLSGDCWACGETGGGKHPAETAKALADALERQGRPGFSIHAITGSKDIAFPNLDAQIRAMGEYPQDFGEALAYDVMEGGVHDYETIFRYLYNALPGLFAR